MSRLAATIARSQWGKYFGPDINSFLSWPDLPEPLLKDLNDYKPDDTALQTPRNEAIIQQMLIEAGESTRKLPYHNLQHFQRAYLEAFRVIEEIEKLGVMIPEVVKEAFFVGVAGHDHQHPGSTYLSEDEQKNAPYRSVEGRSALAVDQFLKEKGYNPLYRSFVAYTIASSTFGGKKIGIEVSPHGFFGLLMRAADVVLPEDQVTSMHNDIAVLYGENPAHNPPSTLEELISSRKEFLRYVASTFDQLDKVGHLVALVPEEKKSRVRNELEKTPLSSRLGWNERLEKNRKILTEAEEKRGPGWHLLEISFELRPR